MAEPSNPLPAHEFSATQASFDERELGATIREYRLKQNMSLRALAAQSDVSVSFLSQVERGTASPSIASLMRIANSLGRTIGSLFEHHSTSRLLRRGDGPRLVHPNRQWDETLLTPRDFSHLQVIRSVVAPGGSTGPEMHTYGSGETSMIVEQGELEVNVDGDEMTLYEGDCLSFDPATPHRFANKADAPCVIVFSSAPPIY
ncbi:helix-turn-helix domain-containing protein [Georgenia yuyongxinii]|uniref:Cupin domain-containing protein n=1 Tax=Georgenia yuyongxinii TaxID=2589797 RepID=A0A552WXP2_9MICO|nr:cupin domain-containing protein [Georgenia yuyongxinii]TRW47600.1 cupin domain-containing protein [Georgenia yuyongxinii]